MLLTPPCTLSAVESMHLRSAEARFLSQLLRRLHGLLGANHILVAVLDPLVGG